MVWIWFWILETRALKGTLRIPYSKGWLDWTIVVRCEVTAHIIGKILLYTLYIQLINNTLLSIITPEFRKLRPAWIWSLKKIHGIIKLSLLTISIGYRYLLMHREAPFLTIIRYAKNYYVSSSSPSMPFSAELAASGLEQPQVTNYQPHVPDPSYLWFSWIQ